MKNIPKICSAQQLESFREDVKKNPDSAQAHMKLGTALCQYGLLDEAASELERAVEIYPEFAKAWVNLGGVYLSKWNFDGCIQANEKAIECESDLVQAHYNKGLGHMYKGETEEMVECYTRVIELNPEHAAGTYHLAIAMFARGEKQEAKAKLDRACALGYTPAPEILREFEKEEKAGDVLAFEIEPDSSGKHKQ